MAESELLVKIRTALEGSGITVGDEQLKRFAASVKKAGDAAKDSKDSTRDASGAIEQFGRKGSEAKDAFEGLTSVTRGGETAIFGLAKAWRALTVAFASNPITATLAVLLGLLPLIKKGFDLIGDAAEESARKMAGTGEQTRAAAEATQKFGEASEKYLKQATEDAQAVITAYGGIIDILDQTLNRFKAVEKARADAEISDLELERKKSLSTATSDEERAQINESFDTKVGDVKRKSERRIDSEGVNANALKAQAALDAKEKAEAALAEAAEKVRVATEEQTKALLSGDLVRLGVAFRGRETAVADQEKVEKLNRPIVAKSVQAYEDAQAGLKISDFKNQEFKNEKQGRSIDDSAKQQNNRADDEKRLAELRQQQKESTRSDPQLSTQTKAAADALAETDAAIKKRKDDAFLSSYGTVADTSDLEKERATRQAALEEATKAEQTSYSTKAQQRRSISSEIKEISGRLQPVDNSAPSGPPGTIKDSEGKVITVNRNNRSGPGVIRDGSGRVVESDLTKPGEGKASFDKKDGESAAKGAGAVVDSNSALIAALNANTAALRAAGSGGQEGSPQSDQDGGKDSKESAANATQVEKASAANREAAKQYHQTVVGVLGAQKELSDKQNREMEQIRRELRATSDRR